MTLNFSSWILRPSGPTSIGYQYDNLTDVLQVTGTVPAGWSWDLMVQCGTNLNIIPMEQAEDGSLSVTLTAEMIPLTGYYTMQLRATQGELVKYTNQFRAYVGASLSGDAQWPTVPTEFTQVEQNILDLNQHPPYPGDEGYWMTWDLESGAYVQSQLPLPPVAEGPPGKAATVAVAETITGVPGSDASVENLGTENAALLRFTIPSGPAGPTGTTPQISVTVTTLPAGQDVTVQVSGPAEAPTIAFGIPQGEPGERGPQGLQGFQGWGLSAAELDEDGALVLTLRNPADGQTQTLPPVPIDNSVALQAVAAAITAQGTTQVQRVEEAGDTAVGAVGTAKDAALEAVGQAQTTAVRAVQDAQGTATKAISQAQTAAVGAVNGAKTAAVEAVEKKGAAEQSKLNAIVPPPTAKDAGKALVANAEGSGLVYGDAPGGAGIDDAVIATDATWSSRMIVDSLAPAFSETGAVVMCNPVARYPLSIKAQIVPLQEGTGDPSPDNVRPISGWNSATLTHNDTPITIQFGQTVYGGTLDVGTGVLTVDSIFLKLDTTYVIRFYEFQGKNGVFFLYCLPGIFTRIEGVCSHGICTTRVSIANESWIWLGVNNEMVYWVGVLDALGLSTVAEFKSWLDTQDVQIVYPAKEPVTIQLTPQEILALSGVNTIYADTGDVTVSGRADPNSVIQKLASRIAALESAAVTNA